MGVSLNPTPTASHTWLYRRLALPILALLRIGATPEKLAWSLATGAVIGINPILGSTTLLALAIAAIFRQNLAASQIGNHLMYPLQLVLVLPWISLGSRVFHTAPLPLSPKALFASARTTPLKLVRQLWLWESHAFILWALVALVVAPILALLLTPLLRKLLARVERHQYPLISGI